MKVNVVLNESNTRSKAKSAKGQMKNEMVKLGNTQLVNSRSKNMSLRYLFNGLSQEIYHLRNVKLYSESAELLTTCRRKFITS